MLSLVMEVACVYCEHVCYKLNKYGETWIAAFWSKYNFGGATERVIERAREMARLEAREVAKRGKVIVVGKQIKGSSSTRETVRRSRYWLKKRAYFAVTACRWKSAIASTSFNQSTRLTTI